MKTITQQETARLSIIETQESFKLVKRFEGYSYDTVKNMAYAYVKREVEPLNLYHHKPEIYESNGKWFARVTSYGNITVIDKNGNQIYSSTGIVMPSDCPDPDNSVLGVPIHSVPGITVKIEDDTGKKTEVNESKITVKTVKKNLKKK